MLDDLKRATSIEEVHLVRMHILACRETDDIHSRSIHDEVLAGFLMTEEDRSEMLKGLVSLTLDTLYQGDLRYQLFSLDGQLELYGEVSAKQLAERLAEECFPFDAARVVTALSAVWTIGFDPDQCGYPLTIFKFVVGYLAAAVFCTDGAALRLLDALSEGFIDAALCLETLSLNAYYPARPLPSDIVKMFDN